MKQSAPTTSLSGNFVKQPDWTTVTSKKQDQLWELEISVRTRKPLCNLLFQIIWSWVEVERCGGGGVGVADVWIREPSLAGTTITSLLSRLPTSTLISERLDKIEVIVTKTMWKTTLKGKTMPKWLWDSNPAANRAGQYGLAWLTPGMS